ncbi:hypothetical protein L3Y34_002167 [Caenorhabditis briggsae]|uniref:Uncharacterized protein n=1 Tax=Caenorhabditis briggsae TaxID=6238 RepID=A0AAE9DE75_CAEBR|nr:hypothetical protein L3Y34_002167 [Caenorhabditis briggsae]
MHAMENHVFMANDIRRNKGYQRSMETIDEYRKGEISLICTYSSDGAQFKRISSCMAVATRKTNGKVTFDNSFPSQLRIDEEMIEAAERCIDGYTCWQVPAIYSYIPPTLINIDPFHVRGAGVCKDIVQEFQKPTTWRDFKIMANKLEMLQFSVDSIIPYTKEKIKSQSYKKLIKATGRELDKLSIITSALVGITGSCKSMDFNALVLGWYYCLEFLGPVLAPQRRVRLLLDGCYKLHVVLESQSITLKWHASFKNN